MRWVQFDTLPVDLDAASMRPGDLVFVSGTYFDETVRAVHLFEVEGTAPSGIYMHTLAHSFVVVY